MSIGAQVHWHEGLFLQPHHLQLMQRQLLGAVASERRLGMAYPYGLIEARLSPDALSNMLVRFDRLRVVMPGGLMVDFPENAELPALDIKRPFQAGSGSFTVSLGVPLWQQSRGNAIEPVGGNGQAAPTEDWRIKRLYRISEVERPDENTGENPQPIRVRKVNARLLLPDDDPTDLEVLPLLRIAHGTGEDSGMPRQDPAFVPPCLVLGASPRLRDLVRDLANAVEAQRKDEALRLGRGGFSIENMRGRQFEQMLRLRTFNRFSARLPFLWSTPDVTPFEMYLELRELLGELAALRPDSDPFAAAPYDHDNPAASFVELDGKIRKLLTPGGESEEVWKVEFKKDGRVYSATLEDRQLSEPSDYLLAIRTKTDAAALAGLVEDADRFKVMAASMWDMDIYGVKMKEERHPPLKLPTQVGLHYFRMVRGEGIMWDRIREEKKISIKWRDAESSDFQMTLYMLLPEGRGG